MTASKFVNDDTLLTYDDVLIYPELSLPSRDDADVSRDFGIIQVDHPIIPANMDTIASEALVQKALKSGGIAIRHRYQPFEDRLAEPGNPRMFVSIGVSDDEVKRACEAVRAGRLYGVCIDIAHGHSQKVKSAIEALRAAEQDCHYKPGGAMNPMLIIMAGNIATIEGYKFLSAAGADIIKVGVGPGSLCTTRIVTGCGVPQLSAILSICEARANDPWAKLIVADGGMRSAGDITKALAAGADFVMTGNLFSGCPETPGQIIRDDNGRRRKIYRGMSSRDAQEAWFGGNVIAPEGETALVGLKDEFDVVLDRLIGGIKSGMSYAGCRTLDELREKARFVRVSANTLIENRPWAKR